jgi:hypothetical protein
MLQAGQKIKIRLYTKYARSSASLESLKCSKESLQELVLEVGPDKKNQGYELHKTIN